MDDGDAGAASSASDRSTLRLLSLNFFILPPLVQPKTFKDQRIQHFCSNVLPSYDVVCLQELWHDAVFRRQRKYIGLAAAQGHKDHVISHKPSFFSAKLTDGGCVTSSRFDMPVTDALAFKDNAGFPESLVCNGVVYSAIAVKPGCTLHVFSTHLQSDNQGYVVTPGRNSATRDKQLAEVRQMMQKHGCWVDCVDTVVLCGDLNIDARNPVMREEYQRMLDLLVMEDLFVTVGGVGTAGAASDDPRGLQPGAGPVLHDRYPITLGDVEVDGDGTERPRETVLTGPDDLCSKQCVDFVLVRRGTSSAAALPVRVVSDPLLTVGLPFTQLSDHHAVCAEFRVP